MTKNILGILALLVGVAASTSAMAATQINSPWGNAAVVAVIGRVDWPLKPFTRPVIQAVVWARVSDGACAISTIGTVNGLNDDIEVHGGTGNDLIVMETISEAFCGNHVTPLVYGGHYLDIFGNAGNDRLKSGTGDTWLFGEQGNDRMYSENPVGAQYGGAGDDSIIYGGLAGSAAMFGEDGADCLADTLGNVNTMNCGPGADRWLIFSQPPSGAVECETPVSACPLP